MGSHLTVLQMYWLQGFCPCLHMMMCTASCQVFPDVYDGMLETVGKGFAALLIPFAP